MIVLTEPVKPHILTLNKEDAYVYYIQNIYLNCLACDRCEGKGWYRDTRDFDPVEGYKLADKYTCEVCNGKKIKPNLSSSREMFETYYQQILDNLSAEHTFYHSILSLQEYANRVLGERELALLRKYIAK